MNVRLGMLLKNQLELMKNYPISPDQSQGKNNGRY